MKIVLLLCITLFFSCTKDTYAPLDISNTDNLAISSQWAVITEPYASYFEEANSEAEVNGYGRIGDVIEVTGSSIGENGSLWYYFENGWLTQNSIQIYANKLQADFAAKELQ